MPSQRAEARALPASEVPVFVQVQRIKVYLPPAEELRQECEAFPEKTSSFDYLGYLIKRIRRDPLVGVLGFYSGVYELGPGLEGYTSGRGAEPTHGAVGKPEQLQSISLITFAVTNNPEEIEGFIKDAADEHPWEFPVIEIAPVKLWLQAKFIK